MRNELKKDKNNTRVVLKMFHVRNVWYKIKKLTSF